MRRVFSISRAEGNCGRSFRVWWQRVRNLGVETHHYNIQAHRQCVRTGACAGEMDRAVRVSHLLKEIQPIGWNALSLSISDTSCLCHWNASFVLSPTLNVCQVINESWEQTNRACIIHFLLFAPYSSVHAGLTVLWSGSCGQFYPYRQKFSSNLASKRDCSVCLP